jgi:hypothetical protein
MGIFKDVAGKAGGWLWDNVVPNFKKGGRTGKVIRVVVVKPKRKVQRKKRAKK